MEHWGRRGLSARKRGQAGAVAVPATFLLGIGVDRICLRRLYDRNHLAQVLGTFGLLMFFNELVRVIWGPAALFAAVSSAARFPVTIAFQ